MGKTSIILRLMGEEINNIGPTISVDFLRKDIKRGLLLYSLQLWDTAGQERFDAITKLHFMDAHVVIIVVDIFENDKDDLVSQCNKWYQKVKSGCREDVSKKKIFFIEVVSVFVNKIDLVQNHEEMRNINEWSYYLQVIFPFLNFLGKKNFFLLDERKI